MERISRWTDFVTEFVQRRASKGPAMDILFIVGIVSGATLIVLLELSGVSKLGIWPCPNHWTPRSVTFWTLFRLTNLSALGVIILGCAPGLAQSPLRLGSDTGEALVLAGMLVFVFVQMAMLEERWLLATYGAPFAAYQARVPRFYNLRRARAGLRQWLAAVR